MTAVLGVGTSGGGLGAVTGGACGRPLSGRGPPAPDHDRFTRGRDDRPVAARRCSKRCADGSAPRGGCSASRGRGVEELGLAPRRATRWSCSRHRRADRGRPAAAASEHLLAAYLGFRAMGADVDTARAAALLARAQLMMGAVDEADRLRSRANASAATTSSPRSRGAASGPRSSRSRGEFDEARRLAQEAVDIGGRTDALFDHGMALHGSGRGLPPVRRHGRRPRGRPSKRRRCSRARARPHSPNHSTRGANPTRRRCRRQMRPSRSGSATTAV